MFIKIAFVVLVLTREIQGLYYGFTTTPVCIALEEEPGKTTKFFYEISGEGANNTRVDITPPNVNKRVTFLGSKNNTLLSGDQAYTVCATSLDNNYKSISVDFYTHDKSHLKELALKSELYELHNKIIEVGENLKEIAQN